MTDTNTHDIPQDESTEEPGAPESGEFPASQERTEPGAEAPTAAGSFREASYVVLFIAAVFVINAMETGSYRTPWPVAILTTLAGLGLFGYSWYQQPRNRT